MRKGYIQVYTGNGKGKTTAAVGLAVRAAGAGLRVFFAQFVKKRRCSEHKALARFSDLITVRQYGTGFVRGRPSRKAMSSAEEGLEDARENLTSGQYDVVILDEINVAVERGLIDLEDVISLMESKPPGVELVLTGRYAHRSIIRRADLVTEMKKVKHYMDRGVKARTGIEK